MEEGGTSQQSAESLPMAQATTRSLVRARTQRLAFWLSGPGRSLLSEQQVRQDAVVIAAHPDDESLGCGGTIARKIRSGASVEVIVLSDGGASQWRVGEGEALAAVRRKEAISACGRLGIPPRSIHFLGFPDGGLRLKEQEVAAALLDLLAGSRATQVFVPFRSDGDHDHEAAYSSLSGAMNHLEPRSFEVLEYPIWAWRHWPWVSPGVNIPAWKTSGRFVLGLRFLRYFSTISPITETLGLKRDALQEYTTQLGSAPSLATIDHGEFYDQFTRDWEFFCASRSR